MSVGQTLKFLRWKTDTQIWIVKNKWGIWASSPPRLLVPASYIISIVKQDTPSLYSELEFTRPGLYNLNGQRITYVHGSKPDISSLIDPAYYPDWDTVKEIQAKRDDIRLPELGNIFSYNPLFEYIMKRTKKPSIYSCLYREKMMIRDGSQVSGILQIYKPKPSMGYCDACRLPATYLSCQDGVTVSSCAAHREKISQIISAKKFLENFGLES